MRRKTLSWMSFCLECLIETGIEEVNKIKSYIIVGVFGVVFGMLLGIFLAMMIHIWGNIYCVLDNYCEGVVNMQYKDLKVNWKASGMDFGYRGSEIVWSTDEENAKEKAIRVVSRKMVMARSLISIESVEII